MILDISSSTFKDIMNDENLFLPIRWDGLDFLSTLDSLFNYYIQKLETARKANISDSNILNVDIEGIKIVCGLIKSTMQHYLNGFPSKAYECFRAVMDELMRNPLRIYQKSALEQFNNPRNRNNDDNLQLFRAVCVGDNKPYQRNRVFHTPYNMRSKVSTSRYSIAGYPSLYLGTSLELCCEEIHINPHYDFTLASMFKLERSEAYTNTHIEVVELGVKPQDFVNRELNNEYYRRLIPIDLLNKRETKSAYLLWYPLIAACSYIRTNKNDPFAAEYIIPQLLMQWVRSEIGMKNGEQNHLMGIRYFSCASVKASNMGFNYVFPTSGQQKSPSLPYCSVLTKVFRMTNPIYIHEYESISHCEYYLRESNNFDFISENNY